MLEKTYHAADIEPRIAERWDAADAFRAGAGAKTDADPYTIVIPPPNVTGSLHIGHALNNTLQDILIRFERMRGRNVLWQPGMDHAGIATQMVVERQLMERQQPDRRAMGREKFVERVWQWKNQSGGIIFEQLKRLGASCDWSRERFTMDVGLSKAVLKVFVRLYKQGLIYKDKRLVNWDPKLGTAISDLEVEQIEIKGHLWHLRYRLADALTYRHPYVEDDEGNRRDWKPSDGKPSGHETRDYLVVATTRPETMLGDSGVAVNGDDPRYRDLIGKSAILPLVGRLLPIVADDYADPETGSGAVKMTPAHDFNDFEVGNRHDLRRINVMAEDASITLRDNADFLDGLDAAEVKSTVDLLDGQDRFSARKLLVDMLEAHGLLEQIEDHTHTVPHGDRGQVPIEPYLTDQWYVDAATLAKPAIASVREGRTNFVPKNWENTYFNWMENIQPWCVSRQLWWGHRIPAWYGPDGACFVEESAEDAARAAAAHYPETVELIQDEDVLDTWFSSALWPFSTLGWPKETPELARYYPTDVLVTGFDIIFFWVARMMMMGLHFMEDDDHKPVEPFHTVYVHALVRDKNGAKMSKSKGNVIDPLELIDEYGADALRFTLAIMAAQGRDVKLDPTRIAGYRNFGTKLWNATRLAEMNQALGATKINPDTTKQVINRWILTELSDCAAEVTDNLQKYRFNDAAGAIYRFVWHQFCDWYLELSKPVLASDDQAAVAETRATMAHVLSEIYKLLHPFMPFLSEELWAKTGERGSLLCHADWPKPAFRDADAAGQINWLIELVNGIRSTRTEMNLKPAKRLDLVFVNADIHAERRIRELGPSIEHLARIGAMTYADTAPKGAVQILIGELIACLPLEGIVDVQEEIARLGREVARLDGEISRLEKKLDNEKFVANAPEAIVALEREKLADYQDQRERVAAAVARLG